MMTAIAVAVVAVAIVFGVLFGLPVVLDRYFGGGYAPTKRRRSHRRRHDVLTRDLRPASSDESPGAPPSRNEPEA